MKRTFDSYHVTLYEFVREILVVCPNCSQLALVSSGNFQEFKAKIEGLNLSCKHCGYSRRLEPIERRQSPAQKNGVILKFGNAIDPFFHAELWLLTNYRSRTLWAYNIEHLDFICRIISSDLRERHHAGRTIRGIGSRLPKWILAANARKDLLNLISKLRNK
ncbi:MAG: hypothetical protein K1X68_07330 [Saprospiraceae bacterium]|nr:hypothetical protein [Saprospiraceae bacterium]MBX7176567.1 hypothetical protein [Saprospiraceae bacterium]HMW39023.1 hypothetical protein [Saprospiraceae bacterium]HMX87048.1 hypothetical protein [Saprospiraceae bacterium]HMZ41239.1 hypothetical protein [Saprospiraceae bacterium]